MEILPEIVFTDFIEAILRGLNVSQNKIFKNSEKIPENSKIFFSIFNIFCEFSEIFL